jgi:hypothetical protein
MPEEITSSQQFGDQLTEIYNMLCRSGMNKEYYGASLSDAQRINDILEILIALGTTGSGISALTIWSKEPFEPWIWDFLAATSALLAVAKPIYPTKQADRETYTLICRSLRYLC